MENMNINEVTEVEVTELEYSKGTEVIYSNRVNKNAVILKVYYHNENIQLHTSYGVYEYNTSMDKNILKNPKQLIELVTKLCENKARKHVRDIDTNDVSEIAGNVLLHIYNKDYIRTTTINKSGTEVKYQYPILNSLMRVVAYELVSFVRDNTRLQARYIPIFNKELGCDYDISDIDNDMVALLDNNELLDTLKTLPKPLSNAFYGLLNGDTTISSKLRYNVTDAILLDTQLLDGKVSEKIIINYLDMRQKSSYVSKNKKEQLGKLKFFFDKI